MKLMTLSMLVLGVLISAGCGGVPYGECVPIKPNLVMMEPTSAKTHSPSVLLTVYGSNFVPTSVVFFDGRATATTYISSQQLRAVVPFDLLRGVGPVPVDVFNPRDTSTCNTYASGPSQASNSLTFTLLP